MKLKLDGDGKPVFVDNLPVFIRKDGSEHPLDAEKVVNSLAERNNEARQNRERAEAAEAALKPFKDLNLDPKVAAETIIKMKDIDLSKMVGADKLEEVKREINTAWEGKLSTAEESRKAAEGKLNKYVVGGAFRESKFLKEKTHLIPDFAQSYFGEHCRVGENGDIRVFADKDGKNPVFSQKNPGEPAQFDEAMELLVSQHPQRNSILKSAVTVGAGGQNNGGGGGTGADGKPVMLRSQWDTANEPTRQAHLKAGGSIVDGS